jgi:hypothetical protein
LRREPLAPASVTGGRPPIRTVPAECGVGRARVVRRRCHAGVAEKPAVEYHAPESVADVTALPRSTSTTLVLAGGQPRPAPRVPTKLPAPGRPQPGRRPPSGPPLTIKAMTQSVAEHDATVADASPPVARVAVHRPLPSVAAPWVVGGARRPQVRAGGGARPRRSSSSRSGSAACARIRILSRRGRRRVSRKRC